MQVLQQAAANDDPAVQLQLLRALQPDRSQQETAAASKHWLQVCTAAVLSSSVTGLHHLLATTTPLSQLKLQVT